MTSPKIASTALWQACSAASGAIFVPLVVGRCGLAEFGYVALFQVLSSLQWPFFEVGLDQYGAMHLPRLAAEERRASYGSFWGLRLLAILMLGIPVIMGSFFFADGSLVRLLAPRLWCYGALCSLYPAWFFTSTLHPERLTMGNALARGLTLLCYWISSDRTWLWAVDVQLLGGIVYAGYGLMRSSSTWKISGHGLLCLFKASWPHAWQQQLSQNTPQLLFLQISALWGVSSLGLFSLADRALRLALQIQQPLLHTFLAWMAWRSSSVQPYHSTLLRRGVLWTASLSLGLATGGPFLLHWISQASLVDCLWPCLAVCLVPSLEAYAQFWGLCGQGASWLFKRQLIGLIFGGIWIYGSHLLGACAAWALVGYTLTATLNCLLSLLKKREQAMAPKISRS